VIKPKDKTTLFIIIINQLKMLYSYMNRYGNRCAITDTNADVAHPAAQEQAARHENQAMGRLVIKAGG